MSIGGGVSVDNCSVGSGNNPNSTSNGNFWDLKEYQRCVNRLEVSQKLCTELCHLIHERAEVERTYASSLQKWSSKWSQFIENSLDYGGSKAGWEALCTEANEVAALHKGIRDALEEEVIMDVKQWKKARFHKSTLLPKYTKEVKQLEQSFENAQKPWAKRYRTCQQCRKEYHQACKLFTVAKAQVSSAKASESSTTPEQLSKLEEKLFKAEKEQSRAKENYERSLHELEADESRYMDEMAGVFDNSQEREKERIDFFKYTYLRVHEVLDLSRSARLPQIYTQLRSSIEAIRAEEDVTWWSNTFGVDMPLHCLQFEEYKDSGSGSVSTPPPKLKYLRSPGAGQGAKISSSRNGPVPPPAVDSHVSIEYDESLNPFAEAVDVADVKSVASPPVVMQMTVITTHQLHEDEHHQTPENPFKEDIGKASEKPQQEVEVDEAAHYESVDLPPPQPQPHGKLPRQPAQSGSGDVDQSQEIVELVCATRRTVRALYDYIAAEEDELSFKAGDVFEQLDDGDSQGWSEGVKDGRKGLYPRSYVEEVT